MVWRKQKKFPGTFFQEHEFKAVGGICLTTTAIAENASTEVTMVGKCFFLTQIAVNLLANLMLAWIPRD